MVQEWPGLLDVLAVLDAPGQLRVEPGVSGAATCSLGNGGAEKWREADEAHRLCEVPSQVTNGKALGEVRQDSQSTSAIRAGVKKTWKLRRNRTLSLARFRDNPGGWAGGLLTFSSVSRQEK
jgi:hypothetical protein